MTERRSAAMEVENDEFRGLLGGGFVLMKEWAAFELLVKKGGVFGIGS